MHCTARTSDACAAAADAGSALHDLATRRAPGATHHEHRLAVVGSDPREQLGGCSTASCSARTGADVRPASRSSAEPRARVAFVFPGQGSQWLGMARQLMARGARVPERPSSAAMPPIREHAGWSLLEELAADEAARRFDEIDVVQPALFAMQVALAALWRAWGVEPAAVVGHSMGEVAAAHVAGILSLRDAVRVIVDRSRLLKTVAGRGAMAVVELGADEAAREVEPYKGRLALAVSNSEHSSVVSGEPAAVDALAASLESRGIFCRRVNVNVASHSSQMDPLRPRLVSSLAGLRPHPEKLSFVSTVTGAALPGSQLDASYWGRNLREPVLFGQAVKALRESGCDTFVEVGPHPVLLHSLRQDAGASITAVPSGRRNEHESTVLLESIASLYVAGAELDWSRIYPEGRHVALPSYPWQRERHWFEAGPVGSPPRSQGGILAQRRFSSAAPAAQLWDAMVGVETHPWLADHRVNGVVVLPAAFFFEMALEAARALGFAAPTLLDVTIDSACVLPAKGATHLQLAVSSSTGEAKPSFTISSRDAGESPSWTRHVSGHLAAGRLVPPAAPQVDNGREPATAHFQAMERRKLQYGPAFHAVVETGRSGDSCWGRLELPEGVSLRGHVVHPALLDGALQLAVRALGAVDDGDTFVPVGISRLQLGDHPLPDGPLVAWAVPRQGVRTQFDVSLWSGEGVALANLEGVSFERLEHGLDGVDDALHEVRWEKLAAPGREDARRTGKWLVIAADVTGGEALVAAMQAAGSLVGTANLHAVSGRQAIARILGSERWAGVVSLSALHAPDPGVGGVAGLGPARVAACDVPLALVQALDDRPEKSSFRLVLVSAGAHAVLPGEVPAVAQAPLWGLGRVVVSEMPELSCVLVDLPANPSSGDWHSLAREILDRREETEIALRGGEAMAPRLVAWRPPDSGSRRPVPAMDRPYRVVTRTPGILDGLVCRADSRRRPGPGQVEIAVDATGLNFMNVLSALGSCPGYEGGVGPLGIECSGRVASIGPGVDGFVVGDEVFAVAFDSLATHAVAHASLVRRRPVALDTVEAAGFPIVFLTAHYALDRLAHLARGERVLIHAAAGGVGLAAIQLAHAAGAEVFATAGNEQKREIVRSLGVRHVFDSRSLGFRDEVLAATNGEGVDVVLNSLTGEFIGAGLDVLRPYGRFVEIGKRDIYDDTPLGLAPFRKNLSYFAVDLDRMARDRPSALGTLFDEVLDLLARGAVRPVATRAVPVSRVAEAFRDIAAARHVGKVCVDLRDADAEIDDELGVDLTGKTVMITGGLGGLGLALASWLGERGATDFTLVGRRTPGHEAREAIRRLEDSGARVRVIQADVTSAEDADRLFATVSGQPPFGLIIHAAGLLDDGVLQHQSPERFAEVMAPKVEGAWNLHERCADTPLVFFSSVASLLGLSGQANYAAANAFLDALAHRRRAEGRMGLAINWGPWSAVGLAAAQDNRGSRLAQSGLRSLTPRQGLAAWAAILTAWPTQIAAAPVDWPAYALAFPSSARASLVRTRVVGVEGPKTPTRGASVRESIAAAEPGRKRDEAMEAFIRSSVAGVLRRPAESLDANKPFKALGLDSLMGLELRNRLDAGLVLSLPATLVWNYPTIATLGAHLLERLGLSSAAADEGVVAPAEDELAAILGEIESLPEDEALRLLADSSRVDR